MRLHSSTATHQLLHFDSLCSRHYMTFYSLMTHTARLNMLNYSYIQSAARSLTRWSARYIRLQLLTHSTPPLMLLSVIWLIAVIGIINCIFTITRVPVVCSQKMCTKISAKHGCYDLYSHIYIFQCNYGRNLIYGLQSLTYIFISLINE